MHTQQLHLWSLSLPSVIVFPPPREASSSCCSRSPAPCSPLRCKPTVPLPSPMPSTTSKSSNLSTMRHFSISLCSSTPTASQQASGPLPSLISSTRKQASKLQQCSPPSVPPLLLTLEQSDVTPAATGRTSRSMSTTPTPNHRRPRRAVPRAVAPTSPTTKPSCRRRAVCCRTASPHPAPATPSPSTHGERRPAPDVLVLPT